MPRGDRDDDLAAIEAALWRELDAATRDPQHDWRTPALATRDGETPQVRTVVLREVDAAQRRVVVYSDARAAKVAELQACPHAAMLLWSPRLGWQLRLALEVAVRTDGVAVTSRWARVKMTPHARDYLSAHAPGRPLQAPGEAPPPGERAHFAVLEAEVRAIDWLELHPDGHRRARFAAHEARWLQP